MLTKKDVHIIIDEMIDDLVNNNLDASIVNHVMIWLNMTRRRLLLRSAERYRSMRFRNE